jgi:hypothetical protein
VLPYKTIIFALLLPGVVILGFTASQARFIQQQIMNYHYIIDRCYAVLQLPTTPPVADALKECQQLQEVTTDQEGFLGLIYGIMGVGGTLISSGIVVGLYYSRKIKVSAK